MSALPQNMRINLLKGMVLTRVVDNTLKRLFMTGEISYQGKGFQGKGFRSLGQEAIYAAALALERGHQKDVIAPLIRDLGLVLAFTNHDVISAINAQVAKEGLPLHGKDLHMGALQQGVLPPAAPLAIATCTLVGMAWASLLKGEKRVFVSCIGEGGTSLGEWHEAINLAAVRHLPMIFCIQNNQTALSTPVKHQTVAQCFADKAVGYGLQHQSVDGTDPEAVYAAFKWGATLARQGKGPVVIELTSMRMCGHAHHDDMLYWGVEPPLGLLYPTPNHKKGYMEPALYEQWAPKDPIATYAQKLIQEGIVSSQVLSELESWASQLCEEAVAELKARSWPKPNEITRQVFADERPVKQARTPKERLIEKAPAFTPSGKTYLEAISAAVVTDIQANPKGVYVLGEDVAPPYGNAFMVFHHVPKALYAHFLNTPIAENAIVGACVGMALEGMRPIGEMQFNDFVASGFNQVVNNAAKLYYRTGLCAPMVLRMPWGGLRRAGPYHSQDTAPWFYRTAGLKLVAPSTPWDAYWLLQASIKDKDPVLFYEHIGLYRDPTIRQLLDTHSDKPVLGRAAFRALGNDITLISYGAYVHKALAVSEKLRIQDAITCDVIDLRTLMPLDFESIRASVQHTGRVVLAGEDSVTGSLLQSLAGQISQELFEYLDAPIQVLGSLDTPIPYAPSLEDDYLLSVERMEQVIKELVCF